MCGFCERPVGARATAVVIALPSHRSCERSPFWRWIRAFADTVRAHPRNFLLLMGVVAVLTLPYAYLWLRRARPMPTRLDGDALATILSKGEVEAAADMDCIFDSTRFIARKSIGLQVTVPVDTHWVSLEQIRSRNGPDTNGYTSAMLEGKRVWKLDLYAPYRQPPMEAVHIMAHELAHCWLHERGVAHTSARKVEGFCEWVAGHVLASLDLGNEALARTARHEIEAIRENGYDEYRLGFEYFEGVERAKGSDAVFADLLAPPAPKDPLGR